MRNDEHLYGRYADLLDGEADPGLLRLVGELDGISEGIAPPERLGVATRRALEARAGELQRGGSAPRPAAARRLFGRGAARPSAGTSRPAAQIGGGVQGQPPHRGGPLSRALGVAGLAGFVVAVAVISLSLSATLSRMQPAAQPGAAGQVAAPKPTTPPEIRRLRSLPASLRDIATHVDPGAQRVFLEGSDAQEYDLSARRRGTPSRSSWRMPTQTRSCSDTRS